MAYTTIDDPSQYFQTKIYTGTGSSNAITNDGNSDLQPDWIWGKARNQTYNHNLFDTSRGLTKRLTSDQSDAENTDSTTITAVGSDGFTLGTSANLNGSSVNYVAWQWKANGGSRTTFTESGNNPAGGYQANTTAGFSIVDYTGTGALGTIAHGLGVAPTVLLVKGRDDGHAWIVKHQTGAGNPVLILNATDAASSGSSEFNNTAPTSSVFTVNSAGGTNNDGQKYIAYCFAPIQGYSKFGKYTANGNSNGPFVYTGFKPAWVMVKSSSMSNSETNWVIWDNKRNGYNPNVQVFANQNFTEGRRDDNGADAISELDILSNGFKHRDSTWAQNGSSGDTYIYMAFAESPFVSSEGVPTTAR